MKYRFLVINLAGGKVFGVNKEPPAAVYADMLVVVVDTQAAQYFNKTSEDWKPIQEERLK